MSTSKPDQAELDAPSEAQDWVPKSPPPHNARLKRALRVSAAIVVAAFIFWSARGLAARWSESPRVAVQWWWLALSVLPLLLGSWLHAWGWLQVVHRLGSPNVDGLAALRLFLASILGRYVPGKVGMPAILLAGAASVGIARRAVGASLLLMVLVYVVSGLSVGFAALALSSSSRALDPLVPSAVGDVVTAALLATTLSFALVNRRYLPLRVRAWLGEGEGPMLPWSTIGLFALTWCTWLVHGALLSRSVGAAWGDAWSTSGFFALAPVIGVLALVTPGGLGVREAVIVSGCTPAVGAAPALVIALSSRGVSLAVEVAAWLLALGLERTRQRAHPRL